MKIYSLSIAFLAIFLTTAASAQQRIGYIDQNTVFRDSPYLAKAEDELKKVVQSWRDTLGMIKKHYESRYAAFRADSATLTPDSLTKRKRELINIQLQAQQYERMKVNNQTGGDYVAHRERVLEPVRKQFLAVVAEVAKQQKIDIVLRKDKIIATPEAIDLTPLVMAKLK